MLGSRMDDRRLWQSNTNVTYHKERHGELFTQLSPQKKSKVLTISDICYIINY